MFDTIHVIVYIGFYIAGGASMLVALIHWSIRKDIVDGQQIPAQPFVPHTMDVTEDLDHIDPALVWPKP